IEGYARVLSQEITADPSNHPEARKKLVSFGRGRPTSPYPDWLGDCFTIFWKLNGMPNARMQVRSTGMNYDTGKRVLSQNDFTVFSDDLLRLVDPESFNAPWCAPGNIDERVSPVSAAAFQTFIQNHRCDFPKHEAV